METAGEELSRLRAENASLKELLMSRDAQLAQSIVVAVVAFMFVAAVLWLKSPVQTPAESHTAVSKKPLAVDQQRQYGSVTALDRDDVLSYVFSFVGGGDHLYISGVSRRWRGRYLQYCAQTSTSQLDGKLMTRHRSVVMTESRLQLALSSGLTKTSWTFSERSRAELICKHSLEPEKVMTLLRVHGVPWSTELCRGAALFNKLALLQWLRAHSCPWEEKWALLNASVNGSVTMLEWLLTVTAPWSSKPKQDMLHSAASYNGLAVTQWLVAHGADWPESFSVVGAQTVHKCWSIPAVAWALACGSGWRVWNCEDYAANRYGDAMFKKRAVALLDWAHANGCPCTCGYVQQQQQQQHQQQQ
jgi:hypothetical protein